MNHWCFRLEDAISCIPVVEGKSTRNILISREKEGVYQYNHGDVRSIFNFVNKLPTRARCLHETILGVRCQKMKLDIDVMIDDFTKGNYEEIKDDIIRSVLKTYKAIGISLDLNKNILLFDSSGNEKYSFHIVIHGFYLFTNNHAKELCSRIIENCKCYGKYIDTGVYKKTQNFRLLGCHKAGSERIKNFCRKWSYKGKRVKSVLEDKFTIFLYSLISSTSQCEPLRIELPDIEKIEYDENRDPSFLDIDYYQETVNTLMGASIFTASFRNREVILTRNSKYVGKGILCPSCCRNHERDNATLKITSRGNLIFVCRKGTHVNMGKVCSPIPTVEEDTQVKKSGKVEKIKRNFRDMEDVFS